MRVPVLLTSCTFTRPDCTYLGLHLCSSQDASVIATVQERMEKKERKAEQKKCEFCKRYIIHHDSPITNVSLEKFVKIH